MKCFVFYFPFVPTKVARDHAHSSQGKSQPLVVALHIKIIKLRRK